MSGPLPDAAAQASIADLVCGLERSRIQALLTRQMDVLWHLHAPEYLLVTPSGRTFSRDRYLGDVDAGRLRYLRWDAGPMYTRASPQMALVRYPVTLELDAGDGHGTPFECWHTDSYELIQGRWQAVWSQATAIQGPAA